MSTITKQTVYLPVSEFNRSERAICTIGIPDLYGDKVVEEKGYFFTSLELNQFLSDVIKDTLNTATDNVSWGISQNDDGQEPWIHEDNIFVDRKSITNSFEEIFQKHKV